MSWSNDDTSILLIIAHPDDEAMFFSPLLLSFPSRVKKTILCLSTGNFEGLGERRKRELIASGEVYGIDSEDIHIIDHHSLQDGMTNDWNQSVIASIVFKHLSQYSPNAVYTFDSKGVSSHPNHIATHFGVLDAITEYRRYRNISAYTLTSCNLFRKYIGPFDILVSFFLGDRGADDDTSQINFNICSVHASMNAHYSQYVWYRRLFIIFSRYSYINTFIRV